MSDRSNQYEMFRDPFRMLIMLITLIAEQRGLNFDYDNVPSYENDTFLLRPDNPGGPDKSHWPNFIYKKNQTEITWYRSLGRDIYCNKNLSREEYNRMFVDCMSSLYHS